MTDQSSLCRHLSSTATIGGLHGDNCLLHFGDWQAEYRSLREQAGLVLLETLAHVEITGSERGPFLNRLMTNVIDATAAGSGCEAFLLDSTGHTLAHVLVTVQPESLILCAAGVSADAIIKHLDYYLIRDDVQLHDRSSEQTALLLAGPHTPRILAGLLGNDLATAPLAHRIIAWHGGPVSLGRLGTQDYDAYLLSSAADAAVSLWEELRQHGAAPCGQLAMETLRIEEGWPLYGVDITAKNLPQEVARDAMAVNLGKGCYLGQEIVARLDSRGHVNRLLRGLHFSTPEPPSAGAELTCDGQPAGQVTSSAFSPRTGGSVALAYLRRNFADPGRKIETSLGPAEVVELPMRG